MALSFPEDYRDFLLHENGGALPDDLHVVFSAKGLAWRVVEFYNFSLKNKFALQPFHWKNMSPALPKFVFGICSLSLGSVAWMTQEISWVFLFLWTATIQVFISFTPIMNVGPTLVLRHSSETPLL